MKIKKELNLVELASEMASFMLKSIILQNGYNLNDYFIIDEDESKYTEEAQDIFNEYYDEIYEYLEDRGFKHINN